MSGSAAREVAHRATASSGTSPEHRRFQALLGKIEKARERLRHWQEQAPLFAQAHADRIQPMVDELMAERRAWAFELEQILLSRRWAKGDAATLRAMVRDLAGMFIEVSDPPDEAMKALYNRVADTDFDTESQQQLEAMKSMMEGMAGIDLGDAPVESAEDLLARAQAGMASAQAEFEQRRANKGRARRPSAAEKRAEEDRLRVSQTVREVFRKLAAALHPDRTPAEAGEAERRQRNEAMARANAAYEAGDLLALLTLQLQIEQIDAAKVAQVAATQLRHFNKVLAEQLAELETEVDGRQEALCMGFGLIVERLDPLKLGLVLQDAVRDLQAARAEFDRERRALRGPPALARGWLQAVRRQQRDDELPFF